MMITSEQIVLRKIEAEKRGQQRSFPITEYTTVGAAYINPEQSHAMIDVDGTFLSFSLFFLVGKIKKVYSFETECNMQYTYIHTLISGDIEVDVMQLLTVFV
jgi:hypothetical protein